MQELTASNQPVGRGVVITPHSSLCMPVPACAGALHPALPARLGCAAGHALGVVDAGCWSGGLLPGGAMACWAMTPRRQSPVFAPHTCREGKPPRPYSPEALRRVLQACLHQVRPRAHAAAQRAAAARGWAVIMSRQLPAGRSSRSRHHSEQRALRLTVILSLAALSCAAPLSHAHTRLPLFPMSAAPACVPPHAPRCSQASRQRRPASTTRWR